MKHAMMTASLAVILGSSLLTSISSASAQETEGMGPDQPRNVCCDGLQVDPASVDYWPDEFTKEVNFRHVAGDPIRIEFTGYYQGQFEGSSCENTFNFGPLLPVYYPLENADAPAVIYDFYLIGHTKDGEIDGYASEYGEIDQVCDLIIQLANL